MAAEGRRGRRDNGLDAAAFVPLADVDPRVGEHLLDVLGSAGVPAYLEPSVDVEPYTRAMSLPSPPTDRLWVDRDQRSQARQIVDAETPHGTRPLPTPREDEPSRGLTDSIEERAWQAIVAGWDTAPPETAPPPRPHQAAESPGPVRDPDDLVADPWTEARERRRGRGGPADTDPLPTGKDLDRAAEARAKAEADAESDEVFVEGPPALDDEEHFEPPPPPPVPRPSRHAVVAVLCVALGIALLAVPGFVGLDDRTGMLLGVISILAGGVLLILRLRETRADDGPDDGAIV